MVNPNTCILHPPGPFRVDSQVVQTIKDNCKKIPSRFLISKFTPLDACLKREVASIHADANLVFTMSQALFASNLRFFFFSFLEFLVYLRGNLGTFILCSGS